MDGWVLAQLKPACPIMGQGRTDKLLRRSALVLPQLYLQGWMRTVH